MDSKNMSRRPTLEMAESSGLLEETRKLVIDVIDEDPQYKEGFYLYFFLKVSQFRPERAEKLIREIVKWKKEKNTVRAVIAEYEPHVALHFPVYVKGHTKSGFLAYTARAGRFKIQETITKFGRDAVIYYWLQLLAKAEKLIVECNREARKEFGDEVSTWPPTRKSWLILDMEEMQLLELLSTEVISVALALVKMAVRYFPALEGTLIFVNAGKIMEIFFTLCRPIFKGSPIDLQIFGSNPEKWKPLILEHVDPHQIMKNFGGELEDDF